MVKYNLINGIKVQLTEQEEAEKILKEEKFENEKTARKQKKQDAETKKASGKQKLLDLGLTEQEVKALIGV